MTMTIRTHLTRSAVIGATAAAALALGACGNGDTDTDTGEVTEPVPVETTPEDGDDADADANGADADDDAADAEGVSMADVEANADPESCWAVVDGTVYDLTEWIDEHPGGPPPIQALCGTDATDAFNEQHGDNPVPQERIGDFEVGPLVG